jgi:putative ABC transport system ATP-binding protein
LNASSPVLRVRGLSRRVGRPGSLRTVVDDISFEFNRERIYTILGPSGAGKSSFLRLLNRLDEPTGGEIDVDGKPQREYPPCELRRRVGYLFQTPHLFPGTVQDNLSYASDGLPERQARHLLQQVHLKSAMLGNPADTLSVGEKQRVAIARLLATGPFIVLLDEPTAALDPAHTAGIEQLIKSLVDHDGLTVIMVTHAPEQALRMGGESLLLAAGKLVEHGPCDQVVNHPRTELGRMYASRQLK